MLLRVNIYMSTLGDCSNGGLSSKYDAVLLSTEPEKDDIPDNRPVVKLVKRNLGGREYVHSEPTQSVPNGGLGYMAGGCFIFTSDSRFPSDYPIPLHDRCESPELYAAMSE